MLWLWILAIIVVLAALVLMSKIRLRLYFSRVSDNRSVSLDVHALFGLVRVVRGMTGFEYADLKHLFRKYPLSRSASSGMQGDQAASAQAASQPQDQEVQPQAPMTKDRIMEAFDRLKKAVDEAQQYTGWAKDALSRFRCTEFRWTTRFGTGEAVDTAVLTGMGWGLKSTLLGFLFRFIRLGPVPAVQIDPRFDKAMLATEMVCRLEIRVGSLLMSGILLALRYRKTRAGKRMLQTAKIS